MVELNQAISDMLCKLVNKDSYREIKNLANRRIAPYRYGNGRVLFFDGCEHTNVNWTTTSAGAGGVSISQSMPMIGDKHLKLAVTAADIDSATILRNIPHSYDSFIGLDFYFAMTVNDYQAADDFTFMLRTHKSEGNYTQAVIRILFDGGTNGASLYYMDKAGNYVTLPFKFPINSDSDTYVMYNHVKLVIDANANKYYYIIINNFFYDMQKLEMYGPVGSDEVAFIRPSITANGKTAGAVVDFYLDQITITDQEKLPKYPELYQEYTEL